MSLDQDLSNFLYGQTDVMPDLAEGIDEVDLPDGFYVCRGCKTVTNYWEPGDVCEGCEAEGERQFEESRGN